MLSQQYKHFDQPEPDDRPSSFYNAVGWTAWTAAGALALSRTELGGKLFSYLGKVATDRVVRTATKTAVSTFFKPANLLSFTRKTYDDLTFRQIPIIEALRDANLLTKTVHKKGFRSEVLDAIRHYESPKVDPGTLRIKDILRNQLGQHPLESLPQSNLRDYLIKKSGEAQLFINKYTSTASQKSIEELPIQGVRLVDGKLIDDRIFTRGNIPNILEKIRLPESLYKSAPFKWFHGMQAPLKWAADLLFPVDLLRDQRHLQLFQGPWKGTRDGTRFLKMPVGKVGSGKNQIYDFHLIEKTDLPKGGSKTRYVSGSEDIYNLDPTKSYQGFFKKIPGATDVSLVSATSSVGKGARLRLSDYKHSLRSWIYRKDDAGFIEPIIDPRSWMAKVFRIGDKLGIGPHFATPKFENEFRYSKVGLPLDLLSWVYRKAGQPLEAIEALKKKIKVGDIPSDRLIWTNKPEKTVRGFQGVGDFLNYLTMRPLALLEESTGIGIKPGKNAADSLFRILTRVALPGWAGYQGIRYADYKLREATGYSPLTAAADIYTGTQISLATARDVTGIRKVSKRSEEYFPGSVSSPLSFGARIWGGAAAGAIAGGALSRKLGGGFLSALSPLIGSVTGAMAIGGDLTKSPGELSRIYSGEQLVSSRRSRFWELGRSSFFGDDIQFFRPHFIPLMKSHYQEKGIYGSEREYWSSGTAFPTPENLLGIRPLLDPNYAERKHLYDRPYPLYPNVQLGKDVPIIGPILEGISASLFGMKEHPLLKESLSSYVDVAKTGFDRGYGAAAGKIGQPGIGAPFPTETAYEPHQILGKQISNLQDWTGMPGFMVGAIKSNIFGGGKDFFASTPQLQSSSRMTSVERWFYETLNIGGGLFQSEFTRRMIPRRKTAQDEVNPIVNTAPGWLPGSKSVFAKDREYPIDFHRGDPYCVSFDTLIETKLKFVLAKELKENSTLYSADGSETRVLKTGTRSESPLLKITLSTLPAHPIRVTEDHPFLVRQIKSRNRKARLKRYLKANDLLKQIEFGGTRVDMSNRAGISHKEAGRYWKILEQKGKIRLLWKGKKATVELLDNKPFDKSLIEDGLLFIQARELKKGCYVAYPIPHIEESIDHIDIAKIGKWSAVTNSYVYYVAQQGHAENYEYLIGEEPSSGDPSILYKARGTIKQGFKPKRFPRIFPLNKDTGFFVGLWCAEGSVNTKNGAINTAHCSKEKERVIEAYQSIGLDPQWSTRSYTDGCSATVGCKAIAAVVVFLCGKYAREKRLHDIFLNAPKEFIEGFLDGLFFGDGCEFISSDGRFIKSLSTSSKELALQVRKLIISLGGMASVSEHPPPKNPKAIVCGGRSCTPRGGMGWSVRLYGDSKSYKSCWWFSDKKYVYLRVQDIISDGVEPTAAIQTENGTFCCVGCATHNTKIASGENRLPGPGYEATRPLHSGIPGLYDAVDRLIILSEISPYSDSYKHYKTIVDMWMKAGAIDQSWTRKIIEAKEQITQKEESKKFGTPNLMAAPPVETISLTPTEILSSGRFKAQEMPGRTFQLAGIERNKETSVYQMLTEGNASTADEARRNIEAKYKSLNQRMQELVGTQVRVQVSRDQAARTNSTGDILTLIPGVNKEFFRSEIGDQDQQGMAAHLRGTSTTRTLGNTWYGIVSQEPPFPAGWLKNKLLPIHDPVSYYQQFQTLMPKIGMWEDPWSSYIKPWARGWMDWATPGDYVPNEFRERQEVDRRFQILEYAKAKKNLRENSGDPYLRDYFQKMVKRTPIGINTRSPRDLTLYARGAVPPQERDFIESLSSLTSTSDRVRALELVSPALGNILTNRWKMYLGGEEFNTPEMQGFSRIYNPSTFPARFQGGAANLPDNDWAGFSPMINTDAVKIRYLDRIGENIHNHGFWESQQRQYNWQFPNIAVPEIFSSGPPRFDSFEHGMLSNNVHVRRQSTIGYGSSNNIQINYKKNSSPFFKSTMKNNDYRYTSRTYSVGI